MALDMRSKKLLLLFSLLILQFIWHVNCKKKLKKKKDEKNSKEISKYLESCVLDNMNIKHKDMLSDFKTCLKNIKSKDKISSKKNKKTKNLWSKIVKITTKCLKSKNFPKQNP